MFDLTLPMAQRPWRTAGARLRKASSQGLHLDRIAERRAGAVRLDVADRRRVHAAAAQTAQLQSAACAARLGPVSPADRPSWLVPVPSITPWMRSPSAMARASGFSTTAPHSFSGHEAIRGGVEGAAPPARREHARMAREHVHAGRGHQGDAAGHGQVALARSQRLAGEMHGDERGRAGRVHGHRGPAQIQVVSDPARRGWSRRCPCRTDADSRAVPAIWA